MVIMGFVFKHRRIKSYKRLIEGGNCSTQKTAVSIMG